MKVYFTLLSTMNYLPGVITLAESLKQVKAAPPLIVGISASMPAETESLLETRAIRFLRLPSDSPLPTLPGQAQHHWSNTFDKIYFFGLTQFEKIVYLDSDMIVLDNIDHLFEKPHMSAVAAGRLVHADWTRLNSGLMVIEPEKDLPSRIAKMLEPAMDRAAKAGNEAIGDQDLINEYYKDWPVQNNLHLDEGYNVFHYHADDYIKNHGYGLPMPGQALNNQQCKPIHVLHFVGPVKPWTKRAVARYLLGSFKSNASSWERKAFGMYRKLLSQSQLSLT
ncbi:MAG: hypothetical protein JWR74_2610 [Polaromonas sp.]|jgi:glycogenin glucosyltransferase|nr:hypothetical protein [Polaromonas sp.]